MAVATEFTVLLENRPGALARLAEVLGNAGINIHSLQGFTCESQRIFQVVTDGPEATFRVFDEAALDYIVRDVLVVHLEDRAGALAEAARALAEAQVNIDSVYATLGGEVVLGVDHVARALRVAQRLGIVHPPTAAKT